MEPLGALRRTHTCGALRAATSARMSSCSAGCTASAISAALIFLDIRDRDGVTQVVVARRRGAAGRGQAPADRDSSSAIAGRVERAIADDTVNPKLDDRRGRGRGARDPAAQRGEDAAVPDRRRRAGRPRRRGCAIAISICAGRACSSNLVLRHRVTMAIRRYFDARGLPGDRDADPDQVDARRRARLPRAEPRASGRVLRAAAVAADLQADPDDRRHRPLLPDLPLLPRRGPARRPAARVHAGRRRDVVRDRVARLRHHRAADRRGLQRGRRRGHRRRSGGCRTPRRWRSTARTSRTCASGWRSRTCRRCSPTTTFPVFREILDARRRRARVRRSRRGRLVAQASSTSSSTRPMALGATGLIWARYTGDGGVQSPILKAVGEEALRAALGAHGRRQRRPAADGGGRAGRDVEAARPAPADVAKQARTCSSPTQFEFLWVVDFPLFEWDADDKRW